MILFVLALVLIAPAPVLPAQAAPAFQPVLQVCPTSEVVIAFGENSVGLTPDASDSIETMVNRSRFCDVERFVVTPLGGRASPEQASQRAANVADALYFDGVPRGAIVQEFDAEPAAQEGVRIRVYFR